MKLYVKSKNDNLTKIHLDFIAPTRSELAVLIGSPWFQVQNLPYHVHEVLAEESESNTGAGAVIGGLIGLIGGPLGVLIGGTIGGAIGNESDKEEKAKVLKFNQSNL